MTGLASFYVPDVRRWEYQWYVGGFVVATVATVAVAALMAGFFAEFVKLGSQPTTGSGGPAAASGEQWQTAIRSAGIIVVEIAVIMLVFALYTRLPEWLQDILRENAWNSIAAFLIMGMGFVFRPIEVIVGLAVFLFVFGVVMDALRELERWWVFHNALTVAMAGGFAGLFAHLGLWPAVGIALLLAIIDPLAVKLSGYMVAGARWGLSVGLPVAVVLPRDGRLNIKEWADEDIENDTETDVKLLGNGDLLFPAAVAVAANAAGSIQLFGPLTLLGAAGVIGAVVGVALTTGMHHPGEGAVPAMPALVLGLVPVVALGWVVEAGLATLGVVA